MMKCNPRVPNGKQGDQHHKHSLVDISAPEKKKFSPPPPPEFPNSLQTPSGPSAPPFLETPPLLGFSIKNRPPILPAPRTPPLRLPEQKKNKKYPKRPSQAFVSRRKKTMVFDCF